MKSGDISLVEDAPGDVELILFGAETPSSLSRGASPTSFLRLKKRLKKRLETRMSAELRLKLKVPRRFLTTDSVVTGTSDDGVKGIRW